MDSNIVYSIGLGLLGIIGYFLRVHHTEQIETKKTLVQMRLDNERLNEKVKHADEEITALKARQERHDERTELFYREFGDMVAKAVKPLFDTLRVEISHINKEIQELKK